MIDIFNYKEFSSWIIYLIIYFTIILIINNDKEHFIFMPWNMSTRFYPSYDIRGYPYIYPPYPFIYLTPYTFNADGSYNVKPINKKIK
jgi:hypothetical protein